ncbi:MAG: biotin transporter BioY [Clostridia bacterium]|nr:biotin transporter BioY [Clostridia bacterium]
MEHVKNLTLRAILAAAICVIAPLSVPSGAIPVTLASLIIYVVSACTQVKFSVPAVTIYILLGCFGLPVFSGFTGGFQIVSGITGGYIISYVPCSAVISLLCGKFGNKKIIIPLSMILATLICYVCGTLWYAFQTDSTFLASVPVCVLPFVLCDILKITAATCICVALRPKLDKILK